MDDESAEVSFRRYYIRLDASFYDFDNIDDILANEWYVLGTSFKVTTESEVIYLSEYKSGVGKIAPPRNEEAINAAFTTEVSQYIAPDVTVYNTYYLDCEDSYRGTAVYYKTNKGDFVYYNYFEIGEKLFPVEAFCAYIRADVEEALKQQGLISETDTSESWDLSVYDFRSDSFDLDAPIPEGLLSAGTAPSEKTDIPWYAIGIGIGIGVCGIAAVVVIVSVRIRKRKG